MRTNGISGRPPKIAHGVADVEQAELSAALITALPAAGLELTDDGVKAFSERIGLPLQRASKSQVPEEKPAPFSAERDLTLRRSDLLGSAQSRLVAAAAPRYARRLTAAELPDDIDGTGADVLLQFLETSILQGN